MANIDIVTLSLSSLPSPLTTTNTTALLCTANTKAAGSLQNASEIQFYLQYSFRGQNTASAGSQGNQPNQVVATASNVLNPSTGVYTASFPASAFSAPGTYVVRAVAFTDVNGVPAGGFSNSNVNQGNVPFAISSEFYVVDAGQTDEANQLTDNEKAALDQNSAGWQATTLTGARIKQLATIAGVALSSETFDLPLQALPAGSLMKGALVDVTSATALTGAIVEMGSSAGSKLDVLGSTSVTSTGVHRSTAANMPVLLTSADSMYLHIDVGSGNALSSLEDAFTIIVTWNAGLPLQLNF